jgi:ABC-2 type transport system ATP-binding protein
VKPEEIFMEDIIVVKGLVKRFGDHLALNDLSMTVQRGEIFGFLGPNGAGKTTTVRVISTLADFDEGTVIIGGYDITKNPKEAKVQIGVIQQHISLDKDLTVGENLFQHALLHNIPAPVRKERIESLSKYIGVDGYMDRMINTLSGGWKKRTAIICALIHEPKILFLDEPTVGLDIQARRMLWDLIRKLNGNGTTIFLTSHYIEEIEALCDRVGIIDCGKLIALGTPKDLRDSIGSTTVEYYGEDHRTHYRYFKTRSEANDFTSTLEETETVLIRNTSLEDCFVEITGKTVGGP